MAKDPEVQHDSKNDEEVQKEAVEAARAKVINEFEKQRSGLRSNEIDAAANILQAELLEPIDAIDGEWKARRDILRQSGADLRELRNELMPKLDEIAEFGVAYIDKKSRKTGNLSPEEISKAVSSTNENASLYMKELQQAGREDLKLAIKWSIGRADKSDLPTARAKSLPIVIKYLEEQFPNGKLMPIIWMLLSFIPLEDKDYIIKAQLNLLEQNGGDKELFLEEGNKHGVLSYQEMLELRGGPKFNDEKQEEEEKIKCATLYKLQHKFLDNVKKMSKESYGTRNAWDDVNGGSILAFVLKGAAYATIAGNVFVNGWNVIKGGAKIGSLAKLATNHNIVASAVVLGGTHIYETFIIKA